MANLNIYATIKPSNFNGDIESIDVVCAPGVVGFFGGIFNTTNSTIIDEISPSPPTSFFSLENAVQYFYSSNGQNIVDAVNTAFSSTFTLGQLIRNEPEAETRFEDHETSLAALESTIVSHYNEHEGDIGDLEAALAMHASEPTAHPEVTGPIYTAISAKVDKISGKGLSTEDYTTLEKTKLSTIASAATQNSPDATLLARTNHTGSQAQSTITGLVSALADKNPLITPGAIFATVSADAPTNAPTDARTDYGALAAILGADVNATNGKQNATAANVNLVATKLNVVASAVNTIRSRLQGLGLIS